MKNVTLIIICLISINGYSQKIKGKVFDFGGSRVQGVRNFNQNLGGRDVHYSMLNWNNSPEWYKVAHKMAKMMKG